MAEEKKVQERKPGYNRGILVGLLISIALFMLTYQLLLMSK
jgi:tetrahydromethanopterin S-methyltransferase subunit G